MAALVPCLQDSSQKPGWPRARAAAQITTLATRPCRLARSPAQALPHALTLHSPTGIRVVAPRDRGRSFTWRSRRGPGGQCCGPHPAAAQKTLAGPRTRAGVQSGNRPRTGAGRYGGLCHGGCVSLGAEGWRSGMSLDSYVAIMASLPLPGSQPLGNFSLTCSLTVGRLLSHLL